MKPNVWNIKDALNIPTTSMAAKSGKGGTTSDYSSLSDSQFLFGSQFWPESSQGFSQEIGGPYKSCQPNSQEINELKVSASYHSKPLLFGDGKTANITGEKTLGILDRFEEEKRKAKENEIILQGFRQLHESLENTTLAVKDLNSLVLSLQQDMVSLRADQSKEQSVFGEILSLLDTITAAHSGVLPRSARMAHQTVQTSPGLEEKFCVVSEEKHFCEGIRLSSGTIAHSKEIGDQSVCPGKAKSNPNPNPNNLASFRVFCPVSIEPKQLFNNTAAETSYCTRSLMTTALSPTVTTTGTAGLQRSCMVGTPMRVEPVRPLVAKEENRFTTWSEISRQKKMPKRGQRSQHFRRKKRALILPQRRLNNKMASVNIFEDDRPDEEQENRVPLATVKSVSKNHPPPIKQKGTSGLSNRNGCGQLLNPWSWSQDSCSSQMMVEYKKVEQETAMSEHKTNTIMRQTGIWQLFDFISDSD